MALLHQFLVVNVLYLPSTNILANISSKSTHKAALYAIYIGFLAEHASCTLNAWPI